MDRFDNYRKEHKEIAVTFSFILVLLLGIVLYLFQINTKITQQIEAERTAFGKYYIFKQSNYKAVKTDYSLLGRIEEQYALPQGILKAVRLHENGAKYYEMGCQGIAESIATSKPVSDWQYYMAGIIIQQEMTKFCTDNKEAFVKSLAKRYNDNDKRWAGSVYKIWMRSEKEKK